MKTCVYIDGFNLYYGIRAAHGAEHLWLDLEALARSFVEPDAPLRVKYFTSWVKGDRAAQNRQMVFIKALEAHCLNLEIHYGRFLAKKRQCRKCANIYDLYEEKKTDVNIACHVLMDVFQQRYERIYIVSGDSDLVPAVEAAKSVSPRPRIIIANPPRRKSEELCRAADASFSIKERSFQLSQLPDELSSGKGTALTRPIRWTATPEHV